MAPKRIIIDTDPGIDDILAFLTAFSAPQEELEVLLLSLTFGNIDIKNCLRNTVSLFSIIEKEQAWRTSQGQDPGFSALAGRKPIVALGASDPRHGQPFVSDFFSGIDGLGGVHADHPHFAPQESWQELFDSEHPSNLTEEAPNVFRATNFIPSTVPAHKEILRLLRENEDQSITIVAIGPLTNLALAIEEDPDTFLRAKEVVHMGGALFEPGNVGTVAEFNIHADPIAAAEVLALTSLDPKGTMPPTYKPSAALLPVLQPGRVFPRQLPFVMFPIDVTTHHNLGFHQFRSFIDPLLQAGSPLAEFVNAFVSSTFNKVASLEGMPADKNLLIEMHDPVTVWHVLKSDATWTYSRNLDLRVETVGQWTRGMCVVERRRKVIRHETGGIRKQGNNVRVCEKTGWEAAFADTMLSNIFGTK